MQKIFVLLAICAALLHALYEEEVGLKDWSRENIGAIKFAQFRNSVDAQNKFLFAATTSSVLAAINVRNGDIAWRRVLNEKETVSAFHVIEDRIVTISGRFVRTWSNNGALLWEDQISSSHQMLPRFHMIPQNLYVALLSNSQVQLKNVENGATLWTFKTPEPDIVFHSVIRHAQSSLIRIVALQMKDRTTVKTVISYTLNVINGELKSRNAKSLFSNVKISSMDNDMLVTDANHVVLLDRSSKTIAAVPLDESDRQISATPKLDVESVELVKSGNAQFYMRNKDGTIKCSIQGDKLLQEEQKTAAQLFSNSVTVGDTQHIAIITATYDAVTISIQGNKEEVPISSANHGKPIQAFLQVFQNAQSQIGYRVILAFEDQSIIAVQSGKILWIREESLASIDSSIFVDYPIRSDIPHSHKATISFSTRMQYQLHQTKNALSNLINKAQSFFEAGANAKKAKALDKSTVRDKYGFKKIIVSTTSTGKIFALNTIDGSVLWSLYYPELVSNAKLISKIQLFIVSSDPETDTILTAIMSTFGGSTHIATINAITGQVLNKEILPFTMLSSLALTVDAHTKPVLIISKDLSVHIYPTSLTQIVEQYSRQIFFYVINKPLGEMKSYTWIPKTKNATLVWSQSFSTEIVAIAQHPSPSNEHISSVVYLTGSGEVLHKYLNPHLVAIATIASTRTEENNQVRFNNRLDIYLIDSVSGDIIYRVAHPNAAHTVHMVLDETFLIYHFLNEKQKQFELSVVELFSNDTSIEQSFTNALLNIDTRPSTFSVYGMGKPFALAQSFIFPTGVTAMSTTRTKLGITGKMLLLGLATDQLLGLSKKLVDPRRPRGEVSPTDAEEGLISYNPYLGLDAKNILSYNKTIHRLTNIESSASALESTSHVFAQGLDQFYTRVTPSLSYDLLNEDFSFSLLIITAVGLIAITLFARWYSRRQELYRAWA